MVRLFVVRDQGNTPYNSHGQWEFGTANPGSNTHGGYSPDLSEVISNASAKALEVNGHFIRVKMITDQRAMEIEKLQETLASKTKENNQLTKENDHLNVEVKTLKDIWQDIIEVKMDKDSTNSVKDSDPSADKDKDESDLRKQALEDPKLIHMKSHDSLQDEDHDCDNPNAEEHRSEDSNNDPSEHAKNDDDPIQMLRMMILMQETQSSTPRMATRPPALRQMAPPQGGHRVLPRCQWVQHQQYSKAHKQYNTSYNNWILSQAENGCTQETIV
ncbi:hypothetical protein EDB85DRAFT_1888120 [Lactarius pseudohatsudake]|nr:hypothetical protein EDB85DRAFT_1888120 [Lactarius pseudohatsudake]